MSLIPSPITHSGLVSVIICFLVVGLISLIVFIYETLKSKKKEKLLNAKIPIHDSSQGEGEANLAEAERVEREPSTSPSEDMA